MPELNLQDKATQEAAIIYGNKFLRDDFPISDPYTGASLLPQKPQTERNFEVGITSAVVQEDQKALISDWPENEDPLTQTDLLNNEEDQVQELIFRIRKSFSITYHESLASRLLTLFNDAKEEDSASLGIAVGSLRNFYNFLRLHTNLKCPTISLTPDYNIYASWRGEQNRVFSVHFLPNGDVRFVIFKPNDRHPGRQIRLSGIATTDILMETVAPDAVSYWVSE
jgi:hypothetical protein